MKTSTGTEKTPSKATLAKSSQTPAQLIDLRIAELGDWRGKTFARVRALIRQAVPGLHKARIGSFDQNE